MRMSQVGLLNKWMQPYQTDVRQCEKEETKFEKLGLKNLTAAFLLVLTGYLVSFLVFIIEAITFTISKKV